LAALDLHAGEVLGIVGPNGSGKSTLLRVLGLLQRPTTGAVFFGGQDAYLGDLLPLRRRIATVLQEPLLLNGSVYDNAGLGLKLRGISKSEISRRLKPWLERLGIFHLQSRPVRSLSGGEAQRTSLARAFVIEPELLLLDEPFSALDPASREALLRDFAAIMSDSKITAVLVTHDRNEAFGLAHRIGVLHAAELRQLGDREDIFRRPADEIVAEIVGIENRLHAMVENCDDEWSVVRVGHSRFHVLGRLRPGNKALVCLRPEEIAIAREDSANGQPNRMTGRITGLTRGIMNQRVVVDCGGMTLVAVVDSRLCLKMGEEVPLSFAVQAAHVIPQP
jgi:tungstate transport system ATP-binding protein